MDFKGFMLVAVSALLLITHALFHMLPFSWLHEVLMGAGALGVSGRALWARYGQSAVFRSRRHVEN